MIYVGYPLSKLLIKGNISAMHVSDNNGTVPLYKACEFSSVDVVQYLMEILDESDWNHLDTNRNPHSSLCLSMGETMR